MEHFVLFYKKGKNNMIKIYGIKTCSSVRKALKFFKENDIKIQYIDLRENPPIEKTIDYWTKHIDIDTLMNLKGATYRNLGLKNLELSDDDKIKWLKKDSMLFKRPIIEDGDEVYVAFDEELYKGRFL